MAKDASQHPDTFPSHVGRDRGAFTGLVDAGMRFFTSWIFFVAYLLLAGGWLAIGLARDFDRAWIDIVVVVSAFGMMTLMVVLENTNRHSHLAVQLKLNVLALALLALMRETDHGEAREELRQAIGLEGRVNPKGIRE